MIIIITMIIILTTVYTHKGNAAPPLLAPDEVDGEAAAARALRAAADFSART